MFPKKLVHCFAVIFLLSNSLLPSRASCQESETLPPPKVSALPASNNAEVLLIDLIRKNPQIPKLYLILASLYIKKGEHQKVISLVAFAETNNAQSNELYQREAEALFLMGYHGLCMAALAKMK